MICSIIGLYLSSFCCCLQMTKYSDRLDMDENMQSDMAEGSAWADGDVSDDFPEASGSGSGPGKRGFWEYLEYHMFNVDAIVLISLTVITPTKAPERTTSTVPIAGREIPADTKDSMAVSLHNSKWLSLFLGLSVYLILNR